tara:strand:- start:429 stop:2123 length:1695 start_codon:yes stop_codon:yes gene_type:complete
MGFNFDEQKHPRETTSHDTKHAGEFAPKQQAPVPDGKVLMVQAPKGGAHSNVNGKFYKGGHWMPVHGLSAGRPKSKPKPKADPFGGGAPVADPDGKGRAPVARQLSPEQIAEQKEQDDEKRKWGEVQAGPVSDLYWIGDYPGKTNYHVTKQMRPALTAMTPEHVAAIGKFTREALIANDIAEVKADPAWNKETPAEREEILNYIPEAYQQHRDNDEEMFTTKKLRKSHPAMGDAIHGLRDYVNLPDQPAAFQKLHEFLTDLQKPKTNEKRGPAGLTRKEAIDKAMGDSTREAMSSQQAKRATWIYLGQTGEGWKSAEVTDMHEEDGKMSPVFSIPPDCKPVETVHQGDADGGCCQLCGTKIKNHFKIVNHDRKEVMDVGSECVQGFAPDGMNGEKDAKRQMHDKRRSVVEQLHGAIKEFAAHSEGGEDSWGQKIHRGSATLQQVAKGIGNEEIRNRFWRVSRSLGIDPYSGSWFMDSKKGVTHTGEFQLHNNQNAAGAASTDRKISNWHKKHGEDAEQVIKDLNRFMGKDQYSLSGSVTRYARAQHHSAQGLRAYEQFIEELIS